jgi:hypothetical protein
MLLMNKTEAGIYSGHLKFVFSGFALILRVAMHGDGRRIGLSLKRQLTICN